MSKKNKRTLICPCIDKRVPIDEYTDKTHTGGLSFGLVINSRMLIGIYKPRLQTSVFLVLFNQGGGIWIDTNPAPGDRWWDNLSIFPSIWYLTKLATLIYLIALL